MTKARDYLADRGLAVRNARGRFSLDALKALSEAADRGILFDDWKPKTKTTPVAVATKLFAPLPARRKEQRFHVVDRFGFTINIDWCDRCASSVSRCNCAKGPALPAYLADGAQSVELV